MDPTPWRSPNRRQALGANTATQRSTTKTNRIKIVTPRRSTSALGKTPSERAFTNGGWWGNATAPTSSALLLSLRLYSSATGRIKGQFWRAVSSAAGLVQRARLHQRPSVQPTVTGRPKQAETRAEVTTSDNGPEATNSPPATSPARV